MPVSTAGKLKLIAKVCSPTSPLVYRAGVDAEELFGRIALADGKGHVLGKFLAICADVAGELTEIAIGFADLPQDR